MRSGRYVRQEFLNNIKLDAQKILMDKKVLILGAGGLGSPALLYLAAAGIGKLTIVDNDVINDSNLNRQILYSPDMIGKYKANMAALALKSFNPEITIEPLIENITDDLLYTTVLEYDLVFDCCDNHNTRMIIAKNCYNRKTACVTAGINQFEGFALLSIPDKTACYGCIYGSKAPIENKAPQVLGANAGVFGSLSANLGILYLLDHYKTNKMIIADLYSMNFEEIELEKNLDCSICTKMQ